MRTATPVRDRFTARAGGAWPDKQPQRLKNLMRHLLMVAFHFPPCAVSSGIQRTLRFARDLPQLGWQPVVLTAFKSAYERISPDLLHEIPDGVFVHRAVALDAARHLAIAGRYPAVLARPDRWASWGWPATVAGWRLVRRFRPAAIWSTYPIATAHVIGFRIARMSGLPWVADFRDPMAQDGYPEDPATWRAFARIEARTVRHAAASVFTTRGAARTYRQRYPDAARRVHVIENGFDEASFAGLDTMSRPAPDGRFTLVHSGVVYPSERDPTHLFRALAAFKNSTPAPRLLVRFRASGHDALIGSLARQFGVSDLVEIAPPLPYRAALEEMCRADGLLVLQAANCNEQIPAKVYEYLRAHRPILALTDPRGDTADLLQRCGVRSIAPLDDASAIQAALSEFLHKPEDFVPSAHSVRDCSRESRARELAALLDSVVRG
jgi:glycosyltransferase involved in cell wall biosynthesis